MERGYKITTHGRDVLTACMGLQKPPTITRAAVGSGMIPDGEDMADRHELIQYVSEAAIAERRHEGDRLFLTVQYANGDHPEVGAFALSEFMVFCLDPETGMETDLLYGTLGDYRQLVPSHSESFPDSVWNYPIILVVSSELEVHILASPGLVTWADLLALKSEIIRSIMMGEVTLPLAAVNGEALLTNTGTPIHAVYKTNLMREGSQT